MRKRVKGEKVGETEGIKGGREGGREGLRKREREKERERKTKEARTDVSTSLTILEWHVCLAKNYSDSQTFSQALRHNTLYYMYILPKVIG